MTVCQEVTQAKANIEIWYKKKVCWNQTKILLQMLKSSKNLTEYTYTKNIYINLKKADLFFLERSLFSLILRPPPSVVLLAPSFHLSGTITFESFFSPMYLTNSIKEIQKIIKNIINRNSFRQKVSIRVQKLRPISIFAYF